MTSVAVLSSVVTRMKCWEELSLPNEAIELREVLEKFKNVLADAREAGGILPHYFFELEKQIVWHSYEIVDAIEDALLEDALLKPKTAVAVFSAISRLFSRKEIGRNPKLYQLLQMFRGFYDMLTRFAPSPGPGIHGETNSGSGPEPKHYQEFPESSTMPAGSEIWEIDVSLLHRIKEDLLNPSSDSPEVYIVDEGGMAKTTLARKLIEDEDVKGRFDVFAWVPTKKQFRIKAVLQVIVQQLVPQPQADIRDMNEIQLIGQIFDGVKNKRLLVVLDDIGSKDYWSTLRLAFPLSSSHRVIITTSLNVFESNDHCYRISSLTLPQILTLLEEQANFNPGCKIVGEAIFDISGGSPILATILGKSLQSELATASNQELLLQELYSYKPHKGTPQVLGASYKRLDPKSKACLLCMGQFPQGHDIPVDQLYMLLMAENLVWLKKGEPEISLQTFKNGLYKLARLKFVQVQEDIASTTGLPKACRLHDLVREFCISKGLDEEFLGIVEFERPSRVGTRTPRLAIYLSKYEAGSSIQFANQDKILSLLIFESAEEKSEWPPEIDDLKEFIRLRILNFDAVNFRVQKLPKGIDGLLLLRYLSFRGCWLEQLPSSMSRLAQLETLDLLVHAECNMFIPNNIFSSMRRMLHLYLPRLYQTHGKMHLHPMESLEILVNFNTDVFYASDLHSLTNLRILSAIFQGRHSTDLDDVLIFITDARDTLLHSSLKATSFDCYNSYHESALSVLLECQFIHSIHIEGQIVELPEIPIRGQRVAEMVLDGSQLEHDPMSYLGRFEYLRSLVLSNDAFLGSHIVISAGPLFAKLRSLKLLSLQYVEKLTIQEEAMPELSTLQIVNCGRLLYLSIPVKFENMLNKDNEGDAQPIMPLLSEVNITS